MSLRTSVLGVLAALAALFAASSATAEQLKKLPADFVIPPSKDSPGKVTFSHDSHIDPKKPGCTRCHPRLFHLVDVQRENQAPGGEALTHDGKPITHKAMEQGDYCGACHSKTAFNFDDCTMCHR